MRIKYLFVLVLCAFLTFANDALPATAQGSPRLSTVEIQIWPEYDDPRVLVQIDGLVAGPENFAGEIVQWLPSDAALHATAYMSAAGALVNADAPQKQDAGNGYARLTFTTASPRFHVEYYYNPLPGTPDKRFDFVYKAALPAERVSVIVQQPLKATNFATVPPATSQVEGLQGFQYSRIEFPALAADQALTVTVSYTRTDPNPSIASIPTAPAAVSPAPTTTAAPSQDLLPYAIGAGVAIVIAGGIIVWWLRRRTPPPPTARKQSVRAPAGKAFCTRCGRALRETDNFCPRCGHPRET